MLTDQLAAAATKSADAARDAAKKWKAENDALVACGTILQDIFGMFGIYAFTWFTARSGRRPRSPR